MLFTSAFIGCYNIGMSLMGKTGGPS